MFTLILIGLLTLLIYFYYSYKFSYWSRRGIKTPKRAYPLVGTLFAENELPSREIEQKFVRELGPVYGTYFHCQPIFNTTDKDHIKTVLSDLKTFPNKSSIDFNDKFLVHSINFKNGEDDWMKPRRVQTAYFSPKKFKDLSSYFEKVVANFIENVETEIELSGTGDLEAKKMAKCFSIDIISKVLFAIDVNSYKEQNSPFVQASFSLGNLNFFSNLLLAVLPSSVSRFLKIQQFEWEPINKLGSYFKKMIKERRKSGIKFNDLSEMIMDAIDEKRVQMTEDEVIGNILLSYFAGVEPVANTITQMLYYLSEHPDVQERLHDEIIREIGDKPTYDKITQAPYLDAVLNEVLRLGNNLFFQTRTAAVDTKLGDYAIDKGTEIRLIPYISHMSEEDFEDPRAFNPDRFLKSSDEARKRLFIPFGHGQKSCLGERLVIVEVKFLFAYLLQKFQFCKASDMKHEEINFRGFFITKSLFINFRKR